MTWEQNFRGDFGKTITCRQIRDVLTTQKFASWYGDNGRFGKWVMGDTDAPTDAEILDDIVEFFS